MRSGRRGGYFAVAAVGFLGHPQIGVAPKTVLAHRREALQPSARPKGALTVSSHDCRPTDLLIVGSPGKDSLAFDSTSGTLALMILFYCWCLALLACARVPSLPAATSEDGGE